MTDSIFDLPDGVMVQVSSDYLKALEKLHILVRGTEFRVTPAIRDVLTELGDTPGYKLGFPHGKSKTKPTMEQSERRMR